MCIYLLDRLVICLILNLRINAVPIIISKLLYIQFSGQKCETKIPKT